MISHGDRHRATGHALSLGRDDTDPLPGHHERSIHQRRIESVRLAFGPRHRYTAGRIGAGCHDLDLGAVLLGRCRERDGRTSRIADPVLSGQPESGCEEKTGEKDRRQGELGLDRHGRPSQDGAPGRQRGGVGRSETDQQERPGRAVAARFVVEARAQVIEGPAEPPANRSRSDPLPTGDLARVQPPVVPLQDRRAVRLLQRQHHAAQESLNLDGDDQLIGREHRLGLPQKILVSLPDPVVAVSAASEVPDQAADPAPEVSPVPRRRPESRQPRLLDQVVRGRVVHHQPTGEGPRPAGVLQQVLDLDADVRFGSHGRPGQSSPASGVGQIRENRPARAERDAVIIRELEGGGGCGNQVIA